jgi:predicted DNA-binding helix-hairpin-helix protein
VIQTPFENLPPADRLREHRLYQASFLLRDYGWGTEELPFAPDGNLPTDHDPKRLWAEQHLSHTPIEIITADREQLLRIPGIGPKAADAILKARRKGRLRDLSQLRQLGIRAPEQAVPYILMDGQRIPTQKKLF